MTLTVKEFNVITELLRFRDREPTLENFTAFLDYLKKTNVSPTLKVYAVLQMTSENSDLCNTNAFKTWVNEWGLIPH